MSQNQRNFTRFYTNKAATLYQGGKTYSVQVKDISLQGLLLDSEARLDLSAPMVISINVDNLLPPIMMEANIRYERIEDHYWYGAQCTNIDLDNIQRLRQFMEVLSMSPEDFLRECKALWELHQ